MLKKYICLILINFMVIIGITTGYAASVSIEINETTFPDPYFRAVVLANYSDGYGHVDQSVTNIDVGSQNIQSLEGIEYFSELWTLRCNNNDLTTLDVSSNSKLYTLYCGYNELTTIDLTHNAELRNLFCESNRLTSLDVSGNRSLMALKCQSNELSTIDLTYNTILHDLFCGANQLTSLDVSHNMMLQWLSCEGNELTTLDVHRSLDLFGLRCSFNNLTTIDVTKNTWLSTLECENNGLTVLDVSNNPGLYVLDCTNNQLTSLDISKNTNLLTDPSSQHTAGPLTCYISGTNYWINLNELPYSDLIDYSLVTMTNGGMLDKESGIVLFPTLPSAIIYQYDVLDPKDEATMQVEVEVSNFTPIDSQYDDVHLITSAPANHGSISANKSFASPGTIITANIYPESGYQLKEGTLKYNDVPINGSVFTMPNQDVTISCSFEAIPSEEIEPIIFAGYVDLNYRFKLDLFSWFKDLSVPPIPKDVNKERTNAGYAQELSAWADALGYDLSGLDTQALLELPFAMPYLTTNDEIVFEVSQTQTVKDVMADIIMLGQLQDYVIAEEIKAVASEGNLEFLNKSTKNMLEYLSRYTTYIDEKPNVEYDPRNVTLGLSIIREIIKSTWYVELGSGITKEFINVAINTNPDYDSVIKALKNASSDNTLVAVQDDILETIKFGTDVYQLASSIDSTGVMNFKDTDFIYDIVKSKLQSILNDSGGSIFLKGAANFLLEAGGAFYEFVKLIDKPFGPVTASVKIFSKYLEFATSCIRFIQDQYPSWLFYTHYYILPNYPRYFNQIHFDENGVFDYMDTNVNIESAKTDCDALAYSLLSGAVWAYNDNYRLFASQNDLSEGNRRNLIANALTLAEIRHTNYRDVQRALLEYILAETGASKEPARLSVNCPVEVQLLDANGDIVFRLNTDDEYAQNYTEYCVFYLTGEDRDQKNMILSSDYILRIIPLENGTMSLSIGPPNDTKTIYFFDTVAISVGDIFLVTYQGDMIPVLQKISSTGEISTIYHNSVNILPSELVLNEEYLEITHTDTYQLKCDIQPASLSGIALNWVSSDPEIASVDQNGLITAVAPGNAVISVFYGTTYDLCKVSVLPLELDLVSIDFSTGTGGTISGDFADTYIIGSEFSIMADANEGYAFVQWVTSEPLLFDDLQSSVATITIPTSTQSVRATFKEITTYYLDIPNPEHGIITMNPSGYYQAGETIDLKLVSDQDYYFIRWVSSDGGTFENIDNASTIFIMPADNTTITAVINSYNELIPNTGDQSQPMIWLCFIGAFAMSVLTVGIVLHRKHKMKSQ